MTQLARYRWLSILAVFLAVAGAAAQTPHVVDPGQPVNWNSPLNRGLVGWWLATSNQNGTTLRDIAAYNHGTLTNMDPTTDWVPSTRREAIGPCLDYDGSDDYVQIASASSGPFNAIGTGDFAVFFWATRLSGSASTRKCMGGNWASNVGLFIAKTSTSNQFGAYCGSATELRSSYSVPADNSWHHYGVIRSSGELSWAIDGVVEAEGTAAGTLASAGNTRIAVRSDGTEPWAGAIDDVRVFNRALSADQVRLLYDDSLTGYPATLNWVDSVRYWEEPAAPGGGKPHWYYFGARHAENDRLVSILHNPRYDQNHNHTWALAP